MRMLESESAPHPLLMLVFWECEAGVGNNTLQRPANIAILRSSSSIVDGYFFHDRVRMSDKRIPSFSS